jgi:hypothetical protein
MQGTGVNREGPPAPAYLFFLGGVHGAGSELRLEVGVVEPNA